MTLLERRVRLPHRDQDEEEEEGPQKLNGELDLEKDRAGPGAVVRFTWNPQGQQREQRGPAWSAPSTVSHTDVE